MTSDFTPALQGRLNEQYVDLENCRLFYTQCGSNLEATPIVFLHGWGISAEPYGEVLQLLAQQQAVFAPDLPSFARSSYDQLLPDYDSYARFLLAFLDSLNLHQVHLVGHSLGGGIAITLSALAPKRVKSLVLVDSTGVPRVSLLEVIPRRAIEMTAQLLLPRLGLKLGKIPQVFMHNLLFNTGNLLQALFLSLQVELKHLLPKIQAPCLLLWSDKDLTTPLEAAQEMAATIPDSSLTIVEEGFHEWGLWYPEKFTALLLAFMRQVERPETSATQASTFVQDGVKD
jgi:pimeloyl-ACP methyl ester carboxylesterase